ncbi:hypothetical protein BRADI_1g47810v3 [Brachypodium distachyon]|uniref:Isopenicillin N synthase-like Fe(2+) 2OG dioxygenase domain-containing protein n=1 Tax=Brachypodium distachyon TaxID=15368 RepID=A0A0Q3H8W0_BRADI|nr:hypothetical protein BRADI_1g47810v3 [Brachypodium distachyon]
MGTLPVEGYGNDQVRTEDQRLYWSNRLYLIVEPEDDRNLTHWPTHRKCFRDDLHELTLKSKRIRHNILRAIAKLLELDKDCLVNQFNNKAPTYARFNFEPPCPRPDLVLGIKPHSDVQFFSWTKMSQDYKFLEMEPGTMSQLCLITPC